jgi:hypothetical protein
MQVTILKQKERKKELNYFKISTQTLKVITGSTIVLLLNACTVGPDYNGAPQAQYENLHNVSSNKDISHKILINGG